MSAKNLFASAAKKCTYSCNPFGPKKVAHRQMTSSYSMVTETCNPIPVEESTKEIMFTQILTPSRILSMDGGNPEPITTENMNMIFGGKKDDHRIIFPADM